MKILFLCTGNSCRSQMAEGLFNFYNHTWATAYSAGIEKHGMNERAMKVMKEIGIDLSHHYSKTLDDLSEKNFDYVITVCSHADEKCPHFPAKIKIVHHGFDDPPKLAKGLSDEEEILNHYRRVRDEIKEYIKGPLLNLLKPN